MEEKRRKCHERVKKHRAKMTEEKKAEKRAKDREYKKRMKGAGVIKNINQLSNKAQQIKRRQWKKDSCNYRRKQSMEKEEEIVKESKTLGRKGSSLVQVGKKMAKCTYMKMKRDISVCQKTEEAEKKWRTQRDRYNKEKKAMELSRANGNGLNEIYVTNWTLYKSVENIFCNSDENFSLVNNIEPSACLQEENRLGNCSFTENSQERNFGDSCGSTALVIKSEPDFQESEAESFTSCSYVQSESSFNKSAKRKKDDECVKDLELTVEKTNEFFSAEASSKDSRTSLFCQYLEARLMALNPRRRSNTIRNIEKAIQDAEIEAEEEQ